MDHIPESIRNDILIQAYVDAAVARTIEEIRQRGLPVDPAHVAIIARLSATLTLHHTLRDDPLLARMRDERDKAKEVAHKALTSMPASVTLPPTPQAKRKSNSPAVTKEMLLPTIGTFCWMWGQDWFIETDLGNFHWQDPSYNETLGKGSLTAFAGDYQDFCRHLNVSYGRDKGRHTISVYCGTEWDYIPLK